MEISSNFIDLQKTMKITPFTVFLLYLLNEPFSLTLHNNKSLVTTTKKGRRNNSTKSKTQEKHHSKYTDIHTPTKQNVS